MTPDGRRSARTRRGTTIRWSLLRSFLLLILLLTAAIFILLQRAATRRAERLAERLVHRTMDRMQSDLAFFFEVPSDILGMARGWARDGVLACADAPCLNALFAPILLRHQHIDSVGTGDAAGRGVLLRRVEDGWMNRIVDVSTWGERARIVELSPGLAETASREEDVAYDPRTRPWYRLATEGDAERVHWTDPYPFFTTGEPGITASTVLTTKQGEPFVLSLDVRVEAITEFVRRLDAGAHGLVFVLSADGRVLGLPNHPALQSEEDRRRATLAYIRDLDLPVLEAARAQALEAERQGASAFPFEFEDETWWGAVREFSPTEGPPLLLGVVAPESDFLFDFGVVKRNLALLTSLALLGAGVVAVWLARRYSRPVLSLVDKSDRIRDLDLEPRPPTRTNVRELQALDDAQEDMRKALDSFSRYVPTEVVRDLLARGEAAEIGGREAVLTVLFTDVVDFTAIAETLSAGALTEHMSDYFDLMVNTIRDHGGTVDKLVGDAIVAFWGAPSADPSHAAHALDAVLACQRRLDERNEAWVQAGRPRLATRFGLATGLVVVGNVGARTRLHYTVLGDTVNLASRLEGANRFYGTESLVAESTVEAAGEGYVFRRVDRLAVKGKSTVVTVYELLGPREQVAADTPKRMALEEALEHYQARRFQEALDRLGSQAATDAAAASLARRCRSALADPPSPDWDGVTRLGTK